MATIDPIRTKYFDLIEKVDYVANQLFYLGAALSFAVLLIDKNQCHGIYNLILIIFAITTVALFLIGLLTRLYLIPRAQDKRRQDFFSSACNVDLIHQRTEGYYNNDLEDPIKRIAAQILENSHFSKEIALRMLIRERIKIGVYAILWLVILLNRQTEMGVVLAASQAIFSEQLLAKWIRLEWFKIRCESIFEEVYKLFQSKPLIKKFNVMALESMARYETTKANAAITLSSKIFDQYNERLSNEWNSIKSTLKI